MVVPGSALISLEEYLSTSYEPDCDFVDGVLEERNVGEYDHNRVQLVLGAYFLSNEKKWNTRTAPEQRIRVTAARVRIPDLCVMSRDQPVEQVLTRPPMLCIEILSPEDRYSRIENRVGDFLAMGVPVIWVLDPSHRRVFEYTAAGRRQVTEDVLQLTGTAISINLPELFADLD